MSPLCGVRTIYILAMCISSSVFDFHWPPMLEIGRWTRNVLTWVVWAPCTVGLVAGDTQCWPGACPTDGIYIGFGFDRGLGCFGLRCARPIVWRFCTRRDRYTAVACARFRCDRWVTRWGYASDFGRVSGLVRVSLVGQAPELWNLDIYVNSHDQNIFLFFVIFPNLCCSLVVLCHVMLAINCTELNWMIVALLYSRNWNQYPDLLCVIYCIAHHMKLWQASTFTISLTTHGTNKNVCINTRQHLLVIPFCRCGLTHWGLVSSYGVIGLVNSKKAINYYLMAYYQSNPLLQTT